MFKFKVNKSLQLNGDGGKPLEDYFNFSKISTLGFPHKPSALAWDPFLSLMAIGTHTGSIRIYGAPGVIFIGQHKERLNITKLLFVPKQGRVISLCSDNSLHLWELRTKNEKCELTEIKAYTLGSFMKKITTIYLKSSADILFLGTMCGNIYTLNVRTFEIAESVIYQDVIMQNVPDNVKLSQGCTKVICEQPGNVDCLLIGFQHGLMVLWDNKTLVVVSVFVASQSLESISWHRKGQRFMSSHMDGSYVIWATEDPSKPAEVPMTPYGPFACKSINRIFWKCVKGGDEYIIFNGGMPRAVHGERSTLSVMCGDRHQVLDLSSNVVDFFTICESLDDSDFDNPHSLVILLEEELLAIDLESEDWLPYRLPYLDIPHSSPVTCVHYCPKLQPDVSKLLSSVSSSTAENTYSESEWPIKSGKCSEDQSKVQSLLVTGHESGSVQLWNMSSSSMQLLYTFRTSQTFITYDRCDESDELEDWPPFRKIGNFDALSDDARLAIRRIVFHDITKTLIVGGAAGQILVFTLSDTEVDKDVKPTIVHLVGEYNTTPFSGLASLMVRPGVKQYKKGMHLQALIQLTPPAAITALTFHAEWNILAAGTSHGFLLFDVIQKKCIMSKCTFGIGDACIPVLPEDMMGRSHTLKRSLRESFKKLRKGKSFRQGRDRAGSLSSELMKDLSPDDTLKRDRFTSSPDPTTAASSPSPELRSFASDSESRQSDVSMNSTVKCVYLVQSFIINNVITTPTFWAGTSSGIVYIYTISMPAIDCRATDTVTCQLGKEIQLRHRAPVISIQIVDHHGYPLPDPLEVQLQRVKPADLGRSHRAVICTDEQMKVFSLPSMKSLCKYKVTALERCHTNQISYATFPSKTDLKSSENCAVCFTNTNEITLFSIPDLRKRISFQYASVEDVTVLSSFILNRDGRFIYMTSPCEFEMCSLSSTSFAQSICSVEVMPDIKRSLDNIVLQVHNISLQKNGEKNGRQEDSSALPGGTSNHNDVHNAEEQTNNVGPLANHVVSRQMKRAPLARIDELSSSDEQQCSNYGTDRRSYCGSN